MSISVFASGSACGPRVAGGSPLRLPAAPSVSAHVGPLGVQTAPVSLTLSVLVSPVNCRPPEGLHSDSHREWRVFGENREVCSLAVTRTALDAQRASMRSSLQNGNILVPSGTSWNSNVKKKISLYKSQFTYKRLHRSFILSLDLPVFNLRLFEIIWSVGDHR